MGRALPRRKPAPVRSLPRRAPLAWDGFENGFWEQNLHKAIYYARAAPDAESSEESSSEASTKAAPREPSLTDLQKLIIDAILIQSGSASTDEIEQHVGQYWSSLRKRDGTAYAYDCRRVVLASLANTSNIRPLFKRDTTRGGEQCWKLGPRGAEVDLEQLKSDLKLTKSGESNHTQNNAAQNRRKRTRSSDPDGDSHRAKRVRHPINLDQQSLTQMTPIQRAIAIHLFAIHRHADSFENIAKLIVDKKLLPATLPEQLRKRVHNELEHNPYATHPPPFENGLVEETEWFTLARHVLDILKSLESGVVPPDLFSVMLIRAIVALGGTATAEQAVAFVKRLQSETNSSVTFDPDELSAVVTQTTDFFVLNDKEQYTVTDIARSYLNSLQNTTP